VGCPPATRGTTNVLGILLTTVCADVADRRVAHRTAPPSARIESLPFLSTNLREVGPALRCGPLLPGRLSEPSPLFLRPIRAARSAAHTPGWKLKAPWTAPAAEVSAQGRRLKPLRKSWSRRDHMTIAQRFSVGDPASYRSSPGGTAEIHFQSRSTQSLCH